MANNHWNCVKCGKDGDLTARWKGLDFIGYFHESCWEAARTTVLEPPKEFAPRDCKCGLDFCPEGGRVIPELLTLAEATATDPVNSPGHYKWLPVEAIEITEHFNFCLGNALKYIMRADRKGKPIEDLKKAVWYLQREIDTRLADGDS